MLNSSRTRKRGSSTSLKKADSRINTAKQFRLTAQGRFPLVTNNSEFSTRNGVRPAAATALRLMQTFNFEPRVAAAATRLEDATASR